jgi:hypothetical protein
MGRSDNSKMLQGAVAGASSRKYASRTEGAIDGMVTPYFHVTLPGPTGSGDPDPKSRLSE